MKIIITFMGSMILLTACFDEKLTIKRVDYSGNELRTDGYYYVYFKESDISVIMFLYRNGVALTRGGYGSNNFDEIEKKIKEKKILPKTHWGAFIVSGDTIQHETWIESTGFRAYLFRSKGYIVNDTTFHFTEILRSEKNTTRTIDEVWHFKQFDNKPDSTNKYIK